MIWSCWCSSHVGYIHIIGGTINDKEHREILKDKLLSSVHSWNLNRGLTLQKDNDLKHTAKSDKGIVQEEDKHSRGLK